MIKLMRIKIIFNKLPEIFLDIPVPDTQDTTEYINNWITTHVDGVKKWEFVN